MTKESLIDPYWRDQKKKKKERNLYIYIVPLVWSDVISIKNCTSLKCKNVFLKYVALSLSKTYWTSMMQSLNSLWECARRDILSCSVFLWLIYLSVPSTTQAVSDNHKAPIVIFPLKGNGSIKKHTHKNWCLQRLQCNRKGQTSIVFVTDRLISSVTVFILVFLGSEFTGPIGPAIKPHQKWRERGTDPRSTKYLKPITSSVKLTC